MENDSAKPRIQLEIRLTKPEIETCLRATTFRRSKLRTGIETGILVLVFLYSGIAYVMDTLAGQGGTGETLLVSFGALVVLGILWLLPLFELKREAASLAQSDSVIRLCVEDEGFVFEGKQSVRVPFASCRAQIMNDLFILEIGREIVGIPFHMLGTEDVLFLKQKLIIEKAETEGA